MQLKEVVMSEETAGDVKYEGYISISTVLDELEKDLPQYAAGSNKKGKTVSGKEAILEVLARAADDQKFLARLAADPAKVLKEYNLTLEERAALASGDLRRIESWVGKLDKRLSTWVWCRLQQEKW
jgi:hypothetical protein